MILNPSFYTNFNLLPLEVVGGGRCIVEDDGDKESKMEKRSPLTHGDNLPRVAGSSSSKAQEHLPWRGFGQDDLERKKKEMEGKVMKWMRPSNPFISSFSKKLFISCFIHLRSMKRNQN